MSSATLVEFRTLADVIAHVGGVPPERIRLQPTPGTATEKDVQRAEAKDGLCELIDGILVEKTVGFFESSIACVLIQFLRTHVSKHGLGIILGEAGMITPQEDRLRMPDVSFVSWDHFPDRRLPRRAALPLAPDLVIEIISPSNTEAEMRMKRQECFDNGTTLFWQIYPETRTARIYRSLDTVEEIDESGTLSGEQVLPGFSLSLRELFEEAGMLEVEE